MQSKVNDSVVGILLVGAEGCAEAKDAPWLRDATAEETKLFESNLKQRYAEAHERFDVRDLYVDGTGRPYWLKAVVDHPELPLLARQKAAMFSRVVRLTF